MMIGPRCPTCGSRETETLFTCGHQHQNECFSCDQFFESGLPLDPVYLEPMLHWSLKGEEV